MAGQSAKQKMISLVQLGVVDYATGLRLQQKLVALRKEEKIGDVLLLLEHAPVITLGRNAKATNVIASPELLAQRGVELFECDRGGDVTFHGPGQIVGYPIFDLRGFARGAADASSALRKTLGAVEFVRRLEEVLIRTCADFAIATKREPGLTGVWTDNNSLSFRAEENDSQNRSLESRNLLSAGSRHERHPRRQTSRHRHPHLPLVTSHGFALNVNTDLSYLQPDHPLWHHGKASNLDAARTRQAIDLNAVAESISRNFGVVFQTQMLWVETLDALLGPVVGVPMQPPAELRKLHKEDDSTWA